MEKNKIDLWYHKAVAKMFPLTRSKAALRMTCPIFWADSALGVCEIRDYWVIPAKE
jgi:hypothetical protein